MQVQAEEVSEVTDRFEVSVVPYFILLKVITAPSMVVSEARSAA